MLPNYDKSMLVLKTRVKTQSEEYIANYQYNETLNKNIKNIIHSTQNKRDEIVLRQHKNRGKNLVHQRIKSLIDENSTFLEFSPLAAYEKYDNQFPGAGIITGLGNHKRYGDYYSSQ